MTKFISLCVPACAPAYLTLTRFSARLSRMDSIEDTSTFSKWSASPALTVFFMIVPWLLSMITSLLEGTFT
eukprot:CAMPEP_0116976998 /NCGR_PEP_ID=MMETSP0467-20121206/56859_1 /TAXON_ID=283647 /ORGANISM="Mesodinium pulex, Strain SPMC105" /LENGTH=70 /DNA_ID=CAMNT_0004669963 /DNA_START=374 /DNA_END=586 /DNA_ORIENTATION=+